MIEPEKIQPYPDLKPLDVLTAYASGTIPQAILMMDNNFDIVLNLLQPRTIDELRENGIPVLESQRLLLLVWRLIKQLDNNKYQFAWPVMVGEKLDVTRTKAQQIARLILQETNLMSSVFFRFHRQKTLRHINFHYQLRWCWMAWCGANWQKS